MKKVCSRLIAIILSAAVLVCLTPMSQAARVQEERIIFVGDSRTVLMSKWAQESNAVFIAKNSIGYDWFVNTAVDKVNSIKQPGNKIVIWLGVNDYNLQEVGRYPYEQYAGKINALAQSDWSDCSIYVASAGYVDRTRIVRYYNKDNRSNRSQIGGSCVVDGLLEFNDKLKENFDDSIQWIDLTEVIGIEPYDVNTEAEIWLIRDNGKTDGLHYGKEKTLQIYNAIMEELFL